MNFRSPEPPRILLITKIGEIYSGKAIGTTGNELVAIKFEKVDVKKQVLKLEVAILRKLQESKSILIIECNFVAKSKDN